MKIIAFGINHKTTPLPIRERAFLSADRVPSALQELLQQQAANEAVILSTCNRTEIYSDASEIQSLVNWLSNCQHLEADLLTPHIYHYQDESAIRHILRVASGLDSMILGEPQILGQLKTAVTMAQEAGAIQNNFNRLFQKVFSVTKQVRTHTGIGSSPITIAYAVVQLAKRIYAQLTHCNVLLIGVGDIMSLIAAHLQTQGIKNLMIANRSVSTAYHLAQKYSAPIIPISEIPEYLKQADIVISATASPLPLLGKGAVETALKIRKHKPMLMIDLAVPRDIEPEVADLEDVYLYNMDDLQTLLKENRKNRQQAAAHAESVIETQAVHFMQELRALKAVDTIRSYREKINNITAHELNKAYEELQINPNAKQVLKTFAHQLTQKIMHIPSVQMRKAAYDGELDLLLLAQRLFELE